MNKKKFLKFSLVEMLQISIIAALAIGVKVVAGEMIRSFTSSIGIPGGAVAGGFYMMWLALGCGIVKKRGTATFISLIQAIIVFSGGLPGSHGILTFVTYLPPGLAVDFVFLFSKNQKYNMLHFLIATMLANAMGTVGTNLIFFRLPLLPLLLTLISAMLSGAIGGVLGYYISVNLSSSQEKASKLKALKISLNSKPNNLN